MPGREQGERGKGLSRGDAWSEPSPLDKAAWLPSKRPLGVYRPGADAHPPGAPGTCQTVSSGGDQLIRDLVLWRADPDDSYALTVGSGASPSPPFLKRRRSALPTESSSSPSCAEKPETSPPSPRSGKTRGTTGGPSTSRSGRGPRGHGRLARRSVFLSVLETVTLSPWGAWKRRADDDVVGAMLDNSCLGDGMTLRLGGRTPPEGGHRNLEVRDPPTASASPSTLPTDAQRGAKRGAHQAGRLGTTPAAVRALMTPIDGCRRWRSRSGRRRWRGRSRPSPRS